MFNILRDLKRMETNKRHCKLCNFLLVRIAAGKYPNNKDTKYIDEYGKEWSGRVCPGCHKRNNKQRMRKIRFEKIIYPAK